MINQSEVILKILSLRSDPVGTMVDDLFASVGAGILSSDSASLVVLFISVGVERLSIDGASLVNPNLAEAYHHQGPSCPS